MFEAQTGHRLFKTECVVCVNPELSKYVRHRCTTLARYAHIITGHPICRDCLRGWVSQKHKKSRIEIINDYSLDVVCVL
jgi:hypothetical protein